MCIRDSVFRGGWRKSAFPGSFKAVPPELGAAAHMAGSDQGIKYDTHDLRSGYLSDPSCAEIVGKQIYPSAYRQDLSSGRKKSR